MPCDPGQSQQEPGLRRHVSDTARIVETTEEASARGGHSPAIQCSHAEVVERGTDLSPVGELIEETECALEQPVAGRKISRDDLEPSGRPQHSRPQLGRNLRGDGLRLSEPSLTFAEVAVVAPVGRERGSQPGEFVRM